MRSRNPQGGLMMVVNSFAHFRTCCPRRSPVAHPSRPCLPSRRSALALCLALLPLLVASPSVGATAPPRPRTDVRLSRAASWATQRVNGPHLWIDDGDTLCAAFVEHAYGVSGVYASATDMYAALGKARPSRQHTLAGLTDAPPGALVFFAPTKVNGGSGHVGIYVGSGQFVGVGTGGRVHQHSVRWYSDTIARFVGWAPPPTDWPGTG